MKKLISFAGQQFEVPEWAKWITEDDGADYDGHPYYYVWSEKPELNQFSEYVIPHKESSQQAQRAYPLKFIGESIKEI